MITQEAQLTDKGYVQVTDLTAAKTIGTIPPGAIYALLSPETQGIRWRADGQNPTASVGNTIAAGSSYLYRGPLDKLKVIEMSATAKLNVQFYGI